MKTAIAEIVGRPEGDTWIACPAHFQIGKWKHYADESLLLDQTLSLYCVDFEANCAWFTKVPEASLLDEAAFMYEPQRQASTHIVRVPFKNLSQLVANTPIDPSKIILIHSVGRCGSTLVSRALAARPEVASLSEPDVFTQLVATWGYEEVQDERHAGLLRDCAVIQCLPGSLRGKTRHALKFRSYVTSMARLFSRAVPEAQVVFMYRSLLPWMKSYVRMLGGGDLREPFRNEDYVRLLRRIGSLRDSRADLTWAHVVTSNWIGSMESALELIDDGFRPFLLRYEELSEDGGSAIEALFEWLGLDLLEGPVLEDVLGRDSQVGSPLSRESLSGLTVEVNDDTTEWIKSIVRDLSTRVDGDTIL